MADAPVRAIPADDDAGCPEPGMALCLSAGGYRAMLFHLGALACPVVRTTALADAPTRLKAMSDALRERTAIEGYAVCDAALRAQVDRDLSKPGSLPYQDARV